MKSLKVCVLYVVGLLCFSQASWACSLAEINLGLCPNSCSLAEMNLGLCGAGNAQSNAEAQRQWQIREDKVQARIAKFRATPSYGVIAASEISFGTRWGGGYKTLAESTRVALDGGDGEKYRVIATFSNTCAGVSAPKNNNNINNIIVATDRDGEIALNKAWNQCEAKYGKGKCAMGNNDKAMCSGYDYGVFTK